MACVSFTQSELSTVANRAMRVSRTAVLETRIDDFAPTEKPDVMTSEWPTNHDLTGGHCPDWHTAL